MQVLFVTPECYPLIKTGGLADVAGALPLALQPEGCAVRVLLPGYPAVLAKLQDRAELAGWPDLFGGPARLLGATVEPGLDMLVLEAPHLYDRPGNPYLGPDGRDWPDNARRFAGLAQVGARVALGELPGWRPDLVHGHDWQAGLAMAYLRFAGQPAPPTVLTIHNLAFQGVFAASLLSELGLPPASFTIDGLEYYGRISFLKAGLAYADRLTTVSPSYAREIATPEFGMGLDGLLRARAGQLSGIVNGIDEAVWNPAADPAISTAYDVEHLEAKAANKEALQARLGLEPRADAPLFCVVSRLTEQKGLDLLLAVLPLLLEQGGQLALLGAGEARLEAAFQAAAAAWPGRVGVMLGYDEPLSHQLQAGADAIIVPSRFEPCGLTQLYGLRYGTLPVVARVGGLADTVIDANAAALQDGVATGFQFAPVTSDALAGALLRVFDLYADPARWQLVQRRAMTRAVGWAGPARAYAMLYRSLIGDPDRAAAAA